jgi:hypothetical protein
LITNPVIAPKIVSDEIPLSPFKSHSWADSGIKNLLLTAVWQDAGFVASFDIFVFV